MVNNHIGFQTMRSHSSSKTVQKKWLLEGVLLRLFWLFHRSTLSYDSFHIWLNGQKGGREVKSPGILERWKITTDGTVSGPIYHLRTHQARHTRQSAIASDPRISPITKKRDLNHINSNMQVHYQHN